MSMSGLGFSVLVLQSSNSFDLNAFFSGFVEVNSYCLQGRYSTDGFRVLLPHWGFLKVENFVFVLFSVSNLQNVFPLKHIFSKGPSFCTFVCSHGALNFASRSPESVIDHVLTSQDYIKDQHVRTWLLSSSFAKFQ